MWLIHADSKPISSHYLFKTQPGPHLITEVLDHYCELFWRSHCRELVCSILLQSSGRTLSTSKVTTCMMIDEMPEG